MENLIKSLEQFGQDPAEVGNNLFAFFSQITNMNWEDALAAAGAIGTLTSEAFRASEEDGLQKPKYKRLESCRSVAQARLVTLITAAEKSQQTGMWIAATSALGGKSYDMITLAKALELNV